MMMSNVEMFEPTLEEEIHEVEREIALREFLYPQWIANRKLTQETADRQLNRMKAVRARLIALRDDGK